MKTTVRAIRAASAARAASAVRAQRATGLAGLRRNLPFAGKVSAPGGGRRLRLVDAVALAAGGLLVLKLAGLVLDDAPRLAAEPSPFAQLITHARSNDEPPDPVTTGATTPKEEPVVAKAADGPADSAKNPLLGMSQSPTERALLERLGERRDAIRTRDRDLDVREKLIENAEKRLEGRIGDLKAAEDRVEGAAAKRGETEGTALKAIVTMYETMKPKDAARVFDRLALDVLVPIVLQMNPRKMAEVMALMQSEAAEKLTVALAARARGFGEARPTQASLPPGELPAIAPRPR